MWRGARQPPTHNENPSCWSTLAKVAINERNRTTALLDAERLRDRRLQSRQSLSSASVLDEGGVVMGLSWKASESHAHARRRRKEKSGERLPVWARGKGAMPIRQEDASAAQRAHLSAGQHSWGTVRREALKTSMSRAEVQRIAARNVQIKAQLKQRHERWAPAKRRPATAPSAGSVARRPVSAAAVRRLLFARHGHEEAPSEQLLEEPLPALDGLTESFSEFEVGGRTHFTSSDILDNRSSFGDLSLAENTRSAALSPWEMAHVASPVRPHSAFASGQLFEPSYVQEASRLRQESSQLFSSSASDIGLGEEAVTIGLLEDCAEADGRPGASSFNLRGLGLTDTMGMRLMARTACLRSDDELQISVDLSKNALRMTSYIVDAVLSNEQLTDLDLSSNKLSKASGIALAHAVQGGRLQRLNLSHNRLGDAGVVAIAEVVCSDTKPGLVALDLSDTSFGIRGGLAIAGMVREALKLEELGLSYNSWPKRAAAALAEELCDSPALIRLDFSSNNLASSAEEAEGSALLTAFAKSEHLLSVNLSRSWGVSANGIKAGLNAVGKKQDLVLDLAEARVFGVPAEGLAASSVPIALSAATADCLLEQASKAGVRLLLDGCFERPLTPIVRSPAIVEPELVAQATHEEQDPEVQAALEAALLLVELAGQAQPQRSAPKLAARQAAPRTSQRAVQHKKNPRFRSAADVTVLIGLEAAQAAHPDYFNLRNRLSLDSLDETFERSADLSATDSLSSNFRFRSVEHGSRRLGPRVDVMRPPQLRAKNSLWLSTQQQSFEQAKANKLKWRERGERAASAES